MGTVTEELSLQGYKNHILSVGSTAPMTDAEKELAQVSCLINSNKLFNFISFLKYYTMTSTMKINSHGSIVLLLQLYHMPGKINPCV